MNKEIFFQWYELVAAGWAAGGLAALFNVPWSKLGLEGGLLFALNRGAAFFTDTGGCGWEDEGEDDDNEDDDKGWLSLETPGEAGDGDWVVGEEVLGRALVGSRFGTTFCSPPGDLNEFYPSFQCNQ